MKILISLIIASLVCMSAMISPHMAGGGDDLVEWVSIEQVDQFAKGEQWPSTKRPVVIDVYTTWCGPCKLMDKNTFKNEEVAAYMNQHFYSVKFDAESKNDVLFGSRSYKFVPPTGRMRRGYHELAAALLNGRLAYPSVVFLSDDMERIDAVVGYKNPEQFKAILEYYGEGHYQNQSLDQFMESYADKS